MGLAFGATTTWRNGFCDPASTCDVADVTGDGKADAVTAQRGG